MELMSQHIRNIDRKIKIVKNRNAWTEKCSIWNEKSRWTSKQIAEERVCEEKSVEIIQSERWEKILKKGTEPQGPMRLSNLHVIDILEGEGRKRTEQKRIWRDNGQKLLKFTENKNVQIQETQWDARRINTKKMTPRSSMV